MRDNIMYYPAIVLMVVEAAAAVFLIWSWCAAKKRRCIWKSARSIDQDFEWEELNAEN